MKNTPKPFERRGTGIVTPYVFISTNLLAESAKRLYMCLVHYAGENKTVCIERKAIAKEIPIKPRQIGNALNTLKRVGLVSWKRNGRGIGNTYQLLDPTDFLEAAARERQTTLAKEKSH